jgi:hypothetical protein
VIEYFFDNFNIKMAQQRLISVMENNSISPSIFDHFDYVDAVEQLSEL